MAKGISAEAALFWRWTVSAFSWNTHISQCLRLTKNPNKKKKKININGLFFLFCDSDFVEEAEAAAGTAAAPSPSSGTTLQPTTPGFLRVCVRLTKNQQTLVAGFIINKKNKN